MSNFNGDELSTSPWTSKAEFDAVYDGLYDNDDLSRRRWALDQVSIWQTRQFPSLPTGIEATIALVRAIIQDVLLEHNATMCQPFEISMMYSMALIRFVNLISELKQNKQYHIPVRVIAKEYGIPTWIVAIRHDATHATCPSLPMLRNGAEKALEWLEDNFWKPESKSFCNIIKLQDIPEAEIGELILEFQAQQYDALYLDIKKNKNDTNPVLWGIRRQMKKHRVKFLELFVAPDLFIPTEKKLESLLLESEMLFLDDNKIFLPGSLAEFWTPVIQIIHDLELINDLMKILLKNESDDSDLHKKLCISWAHYLVEESICSDTIEVEKLSDIAKIFHGSKPDFQWLQLLSDGCMNPCKYTPFVIPLLLSHIKLTDNQIFHIMNLVAIRLGETVSESPQHPNLDQPVLTLDRMLKTKAVEASLKQEIPLTTLMVDWEVMPETMEFAKEPLGAGFGVELASVPEISMENVSAIEEAPPNNSLCIEEEPEHFIICNEDDNMETELCIPINFGSISMLTIKDPTDLLFGLPLEL